VIAATRGLPILGVTAGSGEVNHSAADRPAGRRRRSDWRRLSRPIQRRVRPSQSGVLRPTDTPAVTEDGQTSRARPGEFANAYRVGFVANRTLTRPTKCHTMSRRSSLRFDPRRLPALSGRLLNVEQTGSSGAPMALKAMSWWSRPESFSNPSSHPRTRSSGASEAGARRG
jgi:hypothetical protein